jgi:hypothetical protein
MATLDLICLECGEHFEKELADALESCGVPCPACRSTHVRQTFESYLRNALARPKVDLEELRACHRG